MLLLYTRRTSFGSSGKPKVLLRRRIARVYSLLTSGSDKLIEVTVKRCQKQIRGNDCGLFAVANAAALLRGVDPATVKF